MKKITAYCILLVSISIYSQRKPDSSVTLENNLKEVYFNDFSGIPVVQTNKELIGIDPYQSKVIWRQPMGSLGSLSAFGGDGGSVVNNIADTPFIILEYKTLIDTRNGNILLKGNKIETFELLPDFYAVLVMTKGEKGEKNLSLLDMRSSKVLWTTPLKIKTSLMDKAMALSADNPPESFRNLIFTKDYKIALMYGKSIIMIDGNNGKVLMNENMKSGLLFTDSQSKNLFIVDGTKGIVAELGTFGDGITLYDFNTGKENGKIKLADKFAWVEDIDGKLFIKSKGSIAAYDYGGKKIWKDNFQAKVIYDIEKTADGYMVYYGAERMLLDNEGKKVWKKGEAVVSNYEQEDYDFLESQGYVKYPYEAGNLYITSQVIRYIDNKDKAKSFRRTISYSTNLVAYDEVSKSVLVVECGTGRESLYLYNPDKGLLPKTGQSLNIKKPGYLNVFEKSATGYFISNPWEYVILDEKGKITAQKYYSTPGETGRQLMNVASGILDVASAASTVDGAADVVAGSPSALGSQYGVPGTSTAQVEKGAKKLERAAYYAEAADMLYNPERLNSFTMNSNYAFYFTKDKAGNKFLVQVEKTSGKEIDKLKFENNSPKYIIDNEENRVFYINKNNLDIFQIK
ncbi:hypothetical protein [Flavobacterium pallidum]|uniref:Uncharacterized protein n=1 Tax=Flavobacterium pallidum TaxID=2172098 RepID=A0A2S1SG37_9FLAO|nr:hypothetical protein [Flavobacterium pallidum]AWI25312.1 hypothetical protein HYN49_05030 [Flavobacterium pallidum]